jgi:predicted nucleotidyltransferase
MVTRMPVSLHLADNGRAAVAATIEVIRNRWPVERVILFGSKARGDDDSESDIDLLVITSSPVDAAEEGAMQEAVWQTGIQHGRAVQLVVRSHERWWHGIDQATPLRLQIDADGIEVYSR